jgi:diguanylate cyclase (GGDEF)-like protein/PAS domain S-box-containing protein
MQVLLVEDDPDYVELIRRAFAAHQPPFEIVWVDTLAAAQRWLADHTPDLVLTDLYLPDGSGKALLPQDDHSLSYPVIVQTAFGDEQKAVELIKAGAYDYLPKRFDAFRELPYVLERLIQEWRHRREQRELEARLQAGQSVFEAIFENAPLGILYFDQNGVLQAANEQLAQLLDTPRQALLGLELANVPFEMIRLAVQRVLEGEKISQEIDFRLKPFQRGLAIRSQLSPVQLPDGRVIGGVAILQDITAEKNDQDLHQTLYQIATLAHRASAADALYQGIHELVQKVLPAENFYIALWDKTNQSLSFPYWVNQANPAPGLVPFGKGLTEYVLTQGETFLAEEALYQALVKEGTIDHLGTPPQAWLGAPLKDHQGEVFGAVAVQSYDAQVRYGPNQVKIMEYIAAQIAQVLERFRAQEEERRQRRLAEALLEATKAFSESLELGQVFERILNQLQRLVAYDNCSISLIEGQWAHVVAEAGERLPESEPAHHLRWQQLDTLRQIYERSAPLLIQDVRDYPKWQKIAGLEWVQSYLGLPLTIKGKVIGFLSLVFRQPHEFDSAVVDSLMAFANLAGQAIENARLYQQAQEQAIHDELTGIYNRRGLNMFASQEYARAVRYGRPLSMLFSDIDDFKAFNDRYSYAVGDQVLKVVATCLRDNLRRFDLLARFGGDEFVILMPETDQNEAIAVAQRINSSLRCLAIEVSGVEVTITLSFGVAQRLESDAAWEQLLERGSQALRRAKQEGVPLVAAC